jgi:hypothetical protein
MTRRLRVAAASLGLALGITHALALPTSAAAQADDGDQPPSIPWSLKLSAELGAGSSDIDLPVDGIVQRIRPGLFAAGGLAFELEHRASDSVRLGLLVHYQSSIAHGIVERHTDGSEHALDVRSHRLELAFAPTIRFDDSGTWALAAAAGYGFRNFRPDVHHLVTPAYSLSGPHARAQLRLTLLNGALRLSAGPEVQWIVVVGPDLVARGIASQGLGVGGAAALELELGAHWSVGASYRELRSWLDSSQAQRFEDVARFITARLSGTL